MRILCEVIQKGGLIEKGINGLQKWSLTLIMTHFKEYPLG